MAGQEVGLRGRERGAHRRDGPREARALARDAVEVALDEEDGVLFSNHVARAVEAVQELALREARRLGRVQVLGLLVAEGAGSEAEDFAARVADLDGQAVAETVVDTARLGVLLEEAGVHERLFREARAEGALERVPRVRRRAEAEGRALLGREAALLEERPRGGMRAEARAEERRGRRERLGGARVAPAVGPGPVPPNRQRDAREAREVGDGLRKIHAFGLAHERDRVALRPAAEAVVEALVRVDVEGRRLLAVERAQTLPRLPHLLQRRRGADQRDEVRRVQDVALDVVVDVVRLVRHRASRS